MSKTNYFTAEVLCPHCGRTGVVHFEADIGVLDLSTYRIGDVVVRTVPPHPKPIGPDIAVDWERPFWAVGFGECPHCRRQMTARIEVRDRRFAGAYPTDESLGAFDWGPLP